MSAAASKGQTITIPLSPAAFGEVPKVIASGHGIIATGFLYPTGVAGLRLESPRGHIVVLPFLGQMIWDAVFDGRRLTMGSLFPAPRAGQSILDSYGCFAYHAGVLRNGNPGAEDNYPLHGEMPVAKLESATLIFGHDDQGGYVQLISEVNHIQGFGPCYRATPQVRLRPDAAVFDVEMVVENRSAHPMELMYMLHANFDFVANARICQPAPWDAAHTVVRRAVPSHVTPSPEFLSLLEDLCEKPDRMCELSEPELYSPEQVFYVKGLATDPAGQTQMALALPDGDAFTISYRPQDLPHCVRWIFNDGDAQVAAFALPSTCEPEGYTAEKAKGHVRMLAPGEVARFPVQLGYLSAGEAPTVLRRIAEL